MTAHPCPDCRCWTPDDERPAPPAASSPGIRRLALQAAADAVAAAKKTRTAKPEHNQQQGEAK